MATFLITGANRGIGLEMTRQLAARGDEVIVACRQSGPALDALGVEVLEGIDVTSDDSVASLAGKLAGRRIDRLVNNAGILERNALGELDFESVERQFRVNSVAPLRVTAALRGALQEGSKVFVITSRMGSIDDNTSGGSYGYRMSKAAVNMAGFLLHPGWVATDMTGQTGIPVQESAAGLIARMDELDISQTGTFWHQEGYELPW